MLQFACPYCSGTFQVDPSMAGGEAMCPMCHGVVVVPNGPPAPPTGEGSFAPPSEDVEFSFSRKKRSPRFDGLTGDPPPPGQFASFDDRESAPSPPGYDEAALLSMACPHCGSPFQVEAGMAGQQAMCPTCRGVVQIPAVNAGSFQPMPPSGPLNLYSAFGTQAPPPPGPQFSASQFPAPPPDLPSFAPPPTDFGPTLPLQPPTSLVPTPSPPPPIPSPPPTPMPPAQTMRPAPTPLPSSNPLPPGFDGTPPVAPRSENLQPAASITSSPSPPLSALASTPTTDLPFSTRPLVAEPPKVTTPSKPPRPIPISPVGAEQSKEKPTEQPPRSRQAKVEAMLPEVADPNEEVVSERAIAVEEPPADEISPFAAISNQSATTTDPAAEPIRVRATEGKAKLRFVRIILLLVVVLLMLVIAVLVLPRR